MKNFLSFLIKIKSCATTLFCFYDVFEFLNKPWQDYELILVITVVLWTLLIKIPVFFLINFNKSLPLIFSIRNSRFVLWMLYYFIVLVSLSNLVCNYYNGCGAEFLFAKGLIVIAILIWDWSETKEAIKKLESKINK